MQDWQLADDQVQCVESASRFPLRTLFNLKQELLAQPGHQRLQMMVHSNGASPKMSGFAGYIFGAGGKDVDYRLSAQVHHRPAEDGGLLAVTSLNGDVAIYSNSASNVTTGRWSIGGPLKEGELQLLASATNKVDDTNREKIKLQLDVIIEQGKAAVELSSYDANSGQLLAECMLKDMIPLEVDGLHGLVSHLGNENGGYSFSSIENKGELIVEHPQRKFGPVVGVQYTQTENRVRLNAQLVPLENYSNLIAELQIKHNNKWQVVSSTTVKEPSWNALFFFNRDISQAAPFRIKLHADEFADYFYAGNFAGEPKGEFSLASLNCLKHYVGNLKWNSNSIWFPHQELVDNLQQQNLDMLFFAGDQLYEGDIDPVDARNLQKLSYDYLY
ncbi:MAG: hypothetical protein QGF46_08825, partial [Planctomycetota bacterium]|nr:hypothetical protein [Planctomycetota bacterium]